MTGTDALGWLGHVSDRVVLQPRPRVAHHDVFSRKHDRLAQRAAIRARARELERGYHAASAGGRMHAEHGYAVEPLDQLHRRTPPRIDFNRVGNAVADDEVDAVEADETERLGHERGKSGRGLNDLVCHRGITSRDDDVAAVLIVGCAE